MASEEMEGIVVDATSQNIRSNTGIPETHCYYKPRSKALVDVLCLQLILIIAGISLYQGSVPWLRAAQYNISTSVDPFLPGTLQSTSNAGATNVPTNFSGTSQPTLNFESINSPTFDYEASIQVSTCPKHVTDIITCPHNVETYQEGYLEYVRCSDCLKDGSSLNKTFYALKEERRKPKPIYMPIFVPPIFGSSILSQILASSPSVSSMCKKSNSKGGKKIPWQCESTWLLIRKHVFSRGQRWSPEYTNWTKVYALYKEVQPWLNPDAPILMDKSPPNIAKSKGLVDFYEENDMDYRIIVMWRHPCRKEWIQEPERNYTRYLAEILEYVPPRKRFLINYDDLLSRPDDVVKELLNFLPILKSLSLNKATLTGEEPENFVDPDNDKGRILSKGAHGTLATFIPSNECKLSLTSRAQVDPGTMKIWNKFNQQISI